MERTKRISTQTLAIAILSVLLVASLFMTATGAWFTSTDGDSQSATFGTIELSEIGTPITITKAEGDVLMPGDSINVNFDIENNGTASMWVRYKLEITGDGIAALGGTVDSQLPDGYVYDSDDKYVYRTTVLDHTDAAETVNIDFTLTGASIDDSYEGKAISLSLVVEAVQAANNGATYDVADWNVTYESVGA